MRKLIIILGVCALAIGARAQYGSGNGSYGTIGLGGGGAFTVTNNVSFTTNVLYTNTYGVPITIQQLTVDLHFGGVVNTSYAELEAGTNQSTENYGLVSMYNNGSANANVAFPSFSVPVGGTYFFTDISASGSSCTLPYAAQIVYGVGGSGGGGITLAQATAAAQAVVNTNAQNIIYPEAFGAVGNGVRSLISGTMVAGSQTLNSSVAQTWAVGQSIEVHNVNGFGTNLASIITNVTSTTQCTLSNAATIGNTNITFDYGQDDTAAFQAYINYWQSLTNKAGLVPKLGLHVKNYFIDGPYFTNAFCTNQTWVQLQLPYLPYSGGAHLSFEIRGDTAPPSTLYPGATEPNNLNCPVIIDSRTPASIANSTMIGFSSGTAGGFGMNCILFMPYNLEFWGSYPMSQTPFNERFLFGLNGDHIAISSGQPAVYCTTNPPFQNRGIVMPTQANGGENSLDHFLIRDCYVGLELGDHAVFPVCNISMCDIGVGFGGIAANYNGTYWNTFITPNIFANPTNIACLPNSAGGMLKIVAADIEHDSAAVPGFANVGWVTNKYDVDDPSSLIFGEITYLIHNDTVTSVIKVNGGGDLSFYDAYSMPFKTHTDNFTYFLGNTMSFYGSAVQNLTLDCTTSGASGGMAAIDLYSGEMSNPIEIRGWKNEFELVQPNVGVFCDWSSSGLINYVSYSGTSVAASVGVATTGTSTAMTVVATGCTNVTAIDQIAWLTAGTSMTLKDNAGNNEFTGATITALTPIRIQPGGKLTGTGISGTSHSY